MDGASLYRILQEIKGSARVLKRFLGSSSLSSTRSSTRGNKTVFVLRVFCTTLDDFLCMKRFPRRLKLDDQRPEPDIFLKVRHLDVQQFTNARNKRKDCGSTTSSKMPRRLDLDNGRSYSKTATRSLCFYVVVAILVGIAGFVIGILIGRFAACDESDGSSQPSSGAFDRITQDADPEIADLLINAIDNGNIEQNLR